MEKSKCCNKEVVYVKGSYMGEFFPKCNSCNKSCEIIDEKKQENIIPKFWCENTKMLRGEKCKTQCLNCYEIEKL